MTKKSTKVLNENGTSAAETINPPEHGSVPFGGGDDRLSRFHKISAVIGQAASSDEHLTKWYKEMMAWHDKAGHGPGVGDNSGENKSSIEAKPSDAKGAGDMDTKMAADTIKHVAPGNTLHPSLNKQNEAFQAEVQAAIADMFTGEEGLTEDFKTKAQVIFETAVNAKVALQVAQLEQDYEAKLTEEVETIQSTLEEALEAYLAHTQEKWLEENKVEIESALRNEIMSEFAEGLRNLFIEHNFNIPEEKVEVIETLAAKVDELESQYNEAILEIASLREFKEQADKAAIVAEVSEGLTQVDAEKLSTLAESVEAEDVASFKAKLEIVKESLSKKPAKKTTLTEQLEEVDPNLLENAKPDITNPEMAKYVKHMQKELALRD
jgi:hypothetical protein